MSQIRGRDTKPEILLRDALWRMGLRYRLKSKLIGKPDLVFPTARVAIFVDGCHWHCCPHHWVRPKSNTTFWDAKFQRNRSRDAKVNQLLIKDGWRVLRFWEHQVKADIATVATTVYGEVTEAQVAEPRLTR
jgi:DNA mismatch endonuclease (patch repair protein)